MRSTAFSPNASIWRANWGAARPLADKALLVSIYVALGIWGAVPRWIVILVVSRDIMIVAAVIVSWLFGKPIPMNR